MIILNYIVKSIRNKLRLKCFDNSSFLSSCRSHRTPKWIMWGTCHRTINVKRKKESEERAARRREKLFRTNLCYNMRMSRFGQENLKCMRDKCAYHIFQSLKKNVIFILFLLKATHVIALIHCSEMNTFLFRKMNFMLQFFNFETWPLKFKDLKILEKMFLNKFKTNFINFNEQFTH